MAPTLCRRIDSPGEERERYPGNFSPLGEPFVPRGIPCPERRRKPGDGLLAASTGWVVGLLPASGAFRDPRAAGSSLEPPALASRARSGTDDAALGGDALRSSMPVVAPGLSNKLPTGERRGSIPGDASLPTASTPFLVGCGGGCGGCGGDGASFVLLLRSHADAVPCSAAARGAGAGGYEAAAVRGSIPPFAIAAAVVFVPPSITSACFDDPDSSVSFTTATATAVAPLLCRPTLASSPTTSGGFAEAPEERLVFPPATLCADKAGAAGAGATAVEEGSAALEVDAAVAGGISVAVTAGALAPSLEGAACLSDDDGLWRTGGAVLAAPFGVLPRGCCRTASVAEV